MMNVDVELDIKFINQKKKKDIKIVGRFVQKNPQLFFFFLNRKNSCGFFCTKLPIL